MAEYKKGQKVPVPRGVRPMLEEVIGRREHYEKTAFRQVGEAFGYGAKDIGDNQKWLFAVDKDKGVAFTFDPEETVDGEPKRIKEIPMEGVLDSVARLEAARPSNHIVVSIIDLVIPGSQHYHWRLKPKEMVIEIIGKKQMPDPMEAPAIGGKQ